MSTTTGTGTTMAEATLVRLMTMLSPAFPVGAFSYSHGLEAAVAAGLVTDREAVVDWVGDLMTVGSGWNDAVIFAEAWRRTGDGGDLGDLSDLALALAGSAERHLETSAQGEAFRDAAQAYGQTGAANLPVSPAYPVAVGAVTAWQAIELESALAAYLHAFAANLVQASVRLVPLGQRDGVAALAALETRVLETAKRAAGSCVDDLGSATIMAEIMSLRHETQYSRLFRS